MWFITVSGTRGVEGVWIDSGGPPADLREKAGDIVAIVFAGMSLSLCSYISSCMWSHV